METPRQHLQETVENAADALAEIEESLEGVDPFGDEDGDNGWTDADYDADTFASAGWGTDEDYGYYGGDEW